MINLDPTSIIQYIAWLISLFELIVGLYVLVLNLQHTSNRHVGGFLLLLSINTFAVGAVIGSKNIAEAAIPTFLLAATITAIQPALLITSIVLLRPTWLQALNASFWRWLRWIPYLLALIPLSLTLSDLLSGAGLWFTGLDPEMYSGGYAELLEYASGSLHDIVVISNLYITGLIVLLFLLYCSFDRQFNRRLGRIRRRPFATPQPTTQVATPPVASPPMATIGLARLLFVANLFGAIASTLLERIMPPSAAYLVITATFMISYAYGAFQQMISERRMQRGSLQVRLSALVLVITLPLTIALTVFLGNRAQEQIEVDALQRLETASHSITDTTEIWLQYNLKALNQFVLSDIAINMDPLEQKAYLESMTLTYPEMYLISTTDLNGINIARSDGGKITDYSDRAWFQGARDGAPVTYQTLIGRTSGQPALVVSMPIRDHHGVIVGVGMFASDLDEVSHLVEHSPIEGRGITFVVDAQNRVIAHPDQSITAELSDFSQYPPVFALRQGEKGATDLVSFEEGGELWFAYISQLNNGWATITQQQETVLLAPARAFQAVSLIGALLGAALLFALTIFTIRQGIQPIRSLTETALAITEGDLTRNAPVDSEDELGLLARTFNTMTTQLRELITGLEQRVAGRTSDLEQRALQLQVAAEVAREAASIRDLEQLLTHTVNLISDRFDFYHAGIFLLTEAVDLSPDTIRPDETRQPSSRRITRAGSATPGGYAVLRAASSEGGQKMLARQHRLKVGRGAAAHGMVGYTAASGQPRIALDVGQDATYFDNPDLPDTRSEMALPLMTQNRVIGVLDVQSTEPAAFSDEDIAILQILADQIALAIEAARLLRESQQALEEIETLYGAQVRTSWQKQLSEGARTYLWDQTGVRSTGIRSQLDGPALPSITPDEEQEAAPEDIATIKVPIQLRGQRLGNLVLRRKKEQGSWSAEEKEIIDQTITQVALALENARLLEEIQTRAAREQAINRLTANMTRSLDPDRVMQAAISELGNLPSVLEASVFVGVTSQTPRSDAQRHDTAELSNTSPSDASEGGAA